MDKQILCEKCTGHLSSSVALWRGDSLWTNKFDLTDARVTSLALSLFGEEGLSHWTNK